MKETNRPKSKPPLKKRLSGLAKFKEEFCSSDFVAGRRIETENTRSFAYMTYAPSVDAFVDAAYKYKWVRYDFDWMTWLDEVRFEEVASPGRIAEAGVEDLERLLTVIVRQERFAEGSLSVMFEDGVVQAIVERAAEMARAIEV